MSKLKIKEGTIYKLVRVFIQDSSSTTGAGLTGLVYNSSGLTAHYLPEGDATATAITLATMTVGTWATGGFKEVDSTNMPGVYEIGLPDAVIDATSEGSTLVMLKGATNMAPVLLEIELDKIDYRDSVRAGLTALPNAAADAAGGLVISDAGGLDIDARLDAAVSSRLAASAVPTNFSALGINASGHVTRVTLTDTTTANTDMRGTDSAFLAASAPSNFSSLAINASGHVSRVTLTDTTTTNTDMRGTDNALLAASAPTNFGDLAITASTGRVTVGTNADKTGYSISGSITTLDGLNDPTAAAIADAVWDELFSGHTVAGSFGKIVRQIYEGVVSQDGAVNDASATTTTFVTNLTQATDGFYHDKVIVFVSGSLAGQARHIETYTGSTKSITVSQAFTSAPANADEFLILATHEHSLVEIRQEIDSNSTQLAAIVADTNELQTDWANGGRLDLILDSVLSLLDDARSEPGQGAPPVNPDAMTKLDYLYKAWRNKKTQTATTFSLFDDAGTTVDHKATVSDDGTTATIGEVATGP